MHKLTEMSLGTHSRSSFHKIYHKTSPFTVNRVSASGISRCKEGHSEVAGIRREMAFKQHYMNIKEEASKLIATRYINKECCFAFL